MKVGFDLSQIAHTGGVSTYTQNLSEQLAERKELEMIFLYYSLRAPYKGSLPNVKSFPVPPSIAEPFFNKLRLFPVEQLIGKIDIFHSSDWIQPKTKAKKVTTFHDVVPIKYPEWSVPEIIKVHKRRLKLVEEEIDLVIAVSESTKQDLIENTKIPGSKIKVIYEGVGADYRVMPESEVEAFRKKHHLPEKFILAIGGVGQRRNYEGINYAALGYNLVITRQSFKGLKDSELPLLYNAANMLLYPSFYEGFGLPILEAMACGTPVVTSNISAMPEVAGRAALLVDPFDKPEIKRAVRIVMEDKSVYKDLVKKGLAQVKKFSWSKAAQETAEAYRSLING